MLKGIIKIIAFTLVFSISLNSQDIALFADQSELLSNQEIIGGPFCGFIDVNGDYRDDLIRVKNNDKLYIDIQSDNGKKFSNKYIGQIEGGTWAILAGDLDNNGINEIFSAGSYNGATIFSTNNNKSDFEISQTTLTNFFAQNSNFADINNDGWLDAFICDDDGLSKIYLNDGTGTLVDNSNFINMRTVPTSDNSGNYSSVWTDVDGDDDLDLYIGKCRLGIPSFTDPRRVNTLFINNNGTFTESAKQFGIDVGAQSWTSNFGDIDNDGDQDLFMINHDSRSMLFENINNQSFIEIPLLEDGTELITTGYESSFADLNNDGFLDIIIAGEKDFILLNNNNKSFVSKVAPFGNRDIASFALGDANNDGFIDVFAQYRSIFSNSQIPSRLYTNIGNGNHHLSVSLLGNSSNKNGIGAKLLLYGSWGIQTRIIKSGTGYGITNSLTARFGLDEETTVDSLIIKWPSGIIDTYTDIESDKHLLATEGQCIAELEKINASGDLLTCLNESVNLSIDSNHTNWEWSNNATELEITVNNYDHINAAVINEEGCQSFSQTIVIDTLATLRGPDLDILGDFKICSSALPLEISSKNGNELIWHDDSFDNDFEIENSGSYYAVSQNECDTVNSKIINVEIIDPSTISKDSTIYIFSAQTLLIDNKLSNASWFSDEMAENLIGKGNSILTDVIEKDTAFYYTSTIEQEAPIFTGGESIENSINNQNFIFVTISANLFFKVNKESVLHSFTVNAQVEGERIFEIYSIDNPDPILKDTIYLDLGINEVSLNINLAEGNYEVKTDENFNLDNFGFNSPLLNSRFGGVSYPYLVNELITIQGTFIGETVYPYFYDWKVSPNLEDCESDIFKITVDIDTTSAINNLAESHFKIFPNPVNDNLNIESDFNIEKVHIYDITGRLVNKSIPHSRMYRVDLEQLPQGTYIMELTMIEGVFRQTIIVQ